MGLISGDGGAAYLLRRIVRYKGNRRCCLRSDRNNRLRRRDRKLETLIFRFRLALGQDSVGCVLEEHRFVFKIAAFGLDDEMLIRIGLASCGECRRLNTERVFLNHDAVTCHFL